MAQATVSQDVKFDFKKLMPQFYSATNRTIEHVHVPPLSYVAVSGTGSPDSPDFQSAMGALYAIAYPLKFYSKKQLGHDYVVGPAEGLWWADDPAVFAQGDKSQWQWTLLSVLPPWICQDDFTVVQATALAKATSATATAAATATATATSKKDTTNEETRIARAIKSATFLTLDEGECLQVLHVGPYADEAAILNKMHNDVMPAQGLTFNGSHHEIYLGDPRRSAPEKLRTILRQPVKPLTA